MVSTCYEIVAVFVKALWRDFTLLIVAVSQKIG